MLDLVRTIAPTAPEVEAFVSLADAKKHCDVVRADQDDLIQTMIDAAIAHLDGAEGVLGRALLAQTWALRLACFPPPGCGLPLPLPNLISVTSIGYVDTDGVDQVVDPADYQVLDGPVSRVAPRYQKRWPSARRQPRAVTVTYQCGFAAGQAPKALKAAVLLMVGDFYANRETVAVGLSSEIPLSATVKNLIRPYRVART